MRNKRWTFNLPDFQDRVIQGSGTRGNVGTKKAESLPNITGSIDTGSSGTGTATYLKNPLGAFNRRTINADWGLKSGNSNDVFGLMFDASRSSSTYQDSAPVQPNALLIQCCIKY